MSEKKKVHSEPCQHHWLIESGGGETSLGICKFCSEQKAFDNYIARDYRNYHTYCYQQKDEFSHRLW